MRADSLVLTSAWGGRQLGHKPGQAAKAKRW